MTGLLMNLFGILVAILVLSILIAVHEAGHLLMAKWSNIRVDVFSIGMGKPIWGFQYGETYYQIGRLPFGGFCGFGDEENGDKNDPDPRALMNSPLWARLLTVIGGSLFNIIFAYFVMTIMFTVGFKEYQLSNQVMVPSVIEIPLSTQSNEFITTNSPAYDAGLRSKDIIIKINNQPINHFMNIPTALSLSSKKEQEITYVRDKSVTNTVLVTTIQDFSSGMDILGVQPVTPVTISEVLEGTPAQKQGLQPKDIILAVNNKKIQFFYELTEITQQGQPIVLDVLRQNTTNQITVTPIQEGTNWIIGIKGGYPEKIEVLRKADNIFAAFGMAYQNIFDLISQIKMSLGKLFSGKVNIKENISGPVKIVSITGDIAQTMDFVLLVKFMVMLSLALAVFNLLPFPGLDGGAIILQTARSVFKDNQKAEKIIGWIEQAGIILLLVVAVFVLFNDIRTLSQGKENTKMPKTTQERQE